MNTINLVGNVVREAEVKVNKADKKFATFTLAVNRNYKVGDERPTDFIDCIAGERFVNVLEKYVDKGTRIGVVGELQINNFTTKDGDKRRAAVVKVNSLELLGAKKAEAAGSDAAAAKTKAIADGDDYVINGSKCFISNMGPDEGDYVILIALTDPEKKTKGMSAIIVDRGTPGFTLGKTENKMGLRAAPVSELIFDDCRVPKTQLLGQEGRGFMIAMAGLDGGRIGMAAQAVGVAQGAIAAAVEYTGQRVQFGKPINANQGIQWYLADMATTTEAALLMTVNAAKIRDEGGNCGCEAAMAKYFASENAVKVCDKALQMHGGYGYMKDYAIERMYRDARIIPLYEGTSEVQKMVISRNVIK